MQITFDHVSKNFGLISAINDISLNIDSGEFVFIVGPSGAGKSTLLKLILNQIKPSSGDITIGDINITQGTRHRIEYIRRQVGVIFQDYQLIPDKTIEENIALALDIIDFPKNEITYRIDEVLKKVNLVSRRFLFPSQLSGGEQQRAALARALSIRPKIILADEPTGNLDIENTWNLLKLLKDINKNDKTTILMTTHNLDIIDSLRKRTIFLRNGSIEKEENNSLKSKIKETT